MTKPVVIAEVGCNHTGDLCTALRMIEVAAQSGVDVVKFQKRHIPSLFTDAEYYAPHPVPENSYGDTYGEHREYLEFSPEQHAQLVQKCHDEGVEYSTSVWDVVSARQMIELEPVMLKVPSASNLNVDLLRVLATEYSGEIHISVGMTTHEEIGFIVNTLYTYLSASDIRERVVLYACTSGYPVPFSEAAIREVEYLRGSYGGSILGVGYSGHHLGIAIDNAAYALGAQYIERHFTLDRTWKGTDHAASLEPQGLEKLTRDLHATHDALKFKADVGDSTDNFTPMEYDQRKKLKKPEMGI